MEQYKVRMMSRWGVGPSILMYHSISDNLNDPYSVTVNNFQKQILWLAEHGFEVISLSSMIQLVQARDYGSLSKKVVITFDDGYKDFAINALPILLDNGVPATVFLVTEMLGGVASWNKQASDVQLMSEDEVYIIKEKGISIGSHTCTHANLTLVENKELLRQLKNSREMLTHLGESFHAFSYPWGQWTQQISNTVKSSGYKCALSVGEWTRLTAENTYNLPRISMTRDMDLKRFKSILMRTTLEKEIRRQYRKLRETAF